MRHFFVLLLLTNPCFAAEWGTYANERFGVTIDIPPGFVNDFPAPANGDGLTYHSADGKTELLVWGSNLVDGSFGADGQTRMKNEIDDGWNITYQKDFADEWYAFSGSRSERIMYLRSRASCNGTQALYFRIEYPEAQKIDYDPVVGHLAKSLIAGPASDCP